jgi:hypothetical protein
MNGARVPLLVHTAGISNKICRQGFFSKRYYSRTGSMMGLPCARILPPVTRVMALTTAQSTRTGTGKTILYATMD